MSIQINREYFADSIKHRLEDLNLKVGAVETAAAAGVHRITLWRVVNGHGFRFHTYVQICNWLGVPLDRFMDKEITTDGNTLENVKAAIWADEELTDENKDKIWKLFEAMYEALSEQKL